MSLALSTSRNGSTSSQSSKIISKMRKRTSSSQSQSTRSDEHDSPSFLYSSLPPTSDAIQESEEQEETFVLQKVDTIRTYGQTRVYQAEDDTPRVKQSYKELEQDLVIERHVSPLPKRKKALKAGKTMTGSDHIPPKLVTKPTHNAGLPRSRNLVPMTSLAAQGQRRQIRDEVSFLIGDLSSDNAQIQKSGLDILFQKSRSSVDLESSDSDDDCDSWSDHADLWVNPVWQALIKSKGSEASDALTRFLLHLPEALLRHIDCQDIVQHIEHVIATRKATTVTTSQLVGILAFVMSERPEESVSINIEAFGDNVLKILSDQSSKADALDQAEPGTNVSTMAVAS